MDAQNGVPNVLQNIPYGSALQSQLGTVPLQAFRPDGGDNLALSPFSPQTDENKAHWKEEARSSLHEHNP